MFLRKTCHAALGVTLLAWAGMSAANEYRGSDFLGMDLSKTVLSPTPLGPPTDFAPVRIEDSSENTARQASAETANALDRAASGGTHPHGSRLAARADKPRGGGHVKLASRHGNPLDAQASDRRIQTWPCNTGGICDWQH